MAVAKSQLIFSQAFVNRFLIVQKSHRLHRHVTTTTRARSYPEKLRVSPGNAQYQESGSEPYSGRCKWFKMYVQPRAWS